MYEMLDVTLVPWQLLPLSMAAFILVSVIVRFSSKTAKPVVIVKPTPRKANPKRKKDVAEQLKESAKLPFAEYAKPRPGKLCLVLDIDYTLYDHQWKASIKKQYKKDLELLYHFRRPYMNEFLEACYERYDIIIWSSTPFKYVEQKMKHLGLLTSRKFKIVAALNKDHCVAIKKRSTQTNQDIYPSVKPLQIIWSKYPQYNKHNTVHVDDIPWNFHLNKPNGIRIPPFKNAFACQNDTQLFYMTKYLLCIAKQRKDMSKINHSAWKNYLINLLWDSASKVTESLPELPKVLPCQHGDLIGKLEDFIVQSSLKNSVPTISPKKFTTPKGKSTTTTPKTAKISGHHKLRATVPKTSRDKKRRASPKKSRGGSARKPTAKRRDVPRKKPLRWKMTPKDCPDILTERIKRPAPVKALSPLLLMRKNTV